jgi:galactokinase
MYEANSIRIPCRVNIIGEHIDYNGGHVLPFAGNLYMKFDWQELTEKHIIIRSENLNEEHNIKLSSSYNINGGWIGYLENTYRTFKNYFPDIKEKGIQININSSIPIGAGLSSSSAMIAGFLKVLDIVHDVKISSELSIKISSEVEYGQGVKGGLMDQYTITNGLEDHALLLNCQSMQDEKIRLDLGEWSFVLINSMTPHRLANSEYNNRRKTCENALSKIMNIEEINSLCDLRPKHLHNIKSALTKDEFLKTTFAVEENQRTLQVAELLKLGKISAIGPLLTKSHLGLSKQYQVSTEFIDQLVERTIGYPYVAGSRMMGGGFGGCIINLVESDQIDNFRNSILASVNKNYQRKVEVYKMNSVNGTYA